MKTPSLMAGFAIAAGVTFLSLSGTASPAETATRLPDGTVYAGASPNTGKAMYTTPSDAPGVYSWDGGMAYCAGLKAEGHEHWHVPTKNELNVLYNNRATIGNFNETGWNPAGWYWSSSQHNHYAWAQRFSGGDQYYYRKSDDSSLRCVR